MTKKGIKRLTPLETIIMGCLWEMSRATVREVQKRLEPIKPMAYNTVLTVMRILRDKGFLGSERNGRVDIYNPLVKREEVAQDSLRELMEGLFMGSAGALVSQLLDSDELSTAELEAIRSEVNRKLAG